MSNPLILISTCIAGTEPKDKPTPRAITERLVRMRQMAKSAGGNAGNFAIKKGASGNGSAPSTPSKAARNGSSVSKSTTSTSGSTKRKNMEPANAANDENDDEIMKTPSKTPRVNKEASPVESKAIKLELEELGDVQDTPTKRSHKSSVLPAGVVNYSADDEETERESSTSEFLPEESSVKEDADMSFA